MEKKIMYRVNKYSDSIKEDLVERTTDKSVWVKWPHSDRLYRELRNTNEYAWFETREEAFKWIENQHLKEIQHFEREISYHNQKLNDFYKKNNDITRDLKLNELLGL